MNQTEEYSVETEADFLSLMETVDDDLKGKGFQIFQRPFNAWFEISSKFGLNLRFPPFKDVASQNSFRGDDLTIKIFQWYNDKYGDKLKFDPTWKTAILIRGDAYRLQIPLAFGAFVGVCSKESFGKEPPPIKSSSELPQMNILNLVDGLTEGYVKTLKSEELKNIFDNFMLGNYTRYEMETLLDKPLVEQAKGDIDAAVSHIFSNPPQYGLSKWASLQATEKIIKAFIEEKNNNFPFSHDLKKLAKQAKDAGLREIPDALLDLIQCSAGVRYGDPVVSLIESVQAHQACLEICLGVAKQIFVTRRSKGDVKLVPNKYYVDGNGNYTRCISVDGDKATMMFFTEADGGNLEIRYVIDKKVWAEYVGIDIFAITQPLEERYQTILRNEAQKREEAIRKIVPYKE